MSDVNKNTKAKFVSGNIMKHILVMTFSSSVSLFVLFLVDLVDMFFISQLGEVALASAIGFAGTILFFTTSISIGLAIASGALVSKNLGAGKEEDAKGYAYSVFVLGFAFSIVIAFIIWVFVPDLLRLLGANGDALKYASDYLRIIIPSMPILILAMGANATIRALGFAKQSMIVMVSGALVNAILDPIFIFGLDMGIHGAAVASVFARLTMFGFGYYYLMHKHQFITSLSLSDLMSRVKVVLFIAIPAILTNVATPIGNAYVLSVMSDFGDSAVAGMSVIARIIPFAFVSVFALSGAIGPIIGQNFGAKLYTRVRECFQMSLYFSIVYSLIITLILVLSSNVITGVFKLQGEASELVRFFCLWISLSFIFNGLQFICNSAFNNIGYAKYSTIANFSKATLGTIPFVYIGAQITGPKGVLVGQAIGAIAVSLMTYFVYRRVLTSIESGDVDHQRLINKDDGFKKRHPSWPFSRHSG